MNALNVDDGLARRLRDAGRAVLWRPAAAGRRAGDGTVARVAWLRDEQALVVVHEGSGGGTVEVSAGPVGALVLLLEIDRRGAPTLLGSRNAAPLRGFPDGSIVVLWGVGELPADARPTVHDLVELARYALV